MIIGDKVKNTYFKLLSVCWCLNILSFIGLDFSMGKYAVLLCR